MTATQDGCASSTITDRLELAGRRAAAEMERLWRLDIIDPPIGSKDPRAAHSLVEINRIMERNGWRPHGGYKGNGPPQWCGMTAGDAWATAGLDPKWLRVWWASTDRLVAWARYQPFNGHANPRPDGGALRLYTAAAGLTFAPRAGDIVIVGNGKRKAGNHVTVCMAFDGQTFDTISGNGGGIGPNGDRRQGISRAKYRVDRGGYRVMHVIRPGAGDLV